MKVWNAVLAGFRWAREFVLRGYYWLEEKHYDPPVMSFTRILIVTVILIATGVVMGYVLFHREPVDRVVEKRVEIPVYQAVTATPLPCLPAPAVEEEKPAKKPVRKAKSAKPKQKKAAAHDWWVQ